MTPEPEWVDLGLPSGLLWLNCNLGANVPEGTGLYFSWGNVEGHPAGDGYDFSDDNYAASPGAQISGDLPLENDAAYVALGAGCHIPSQPELQELASNCSFIWTSRNGVNGRLVTSNINGRSIFIPALGQYRGTSRVSFNSQGANWSKSYFDAAHAYCMITSSSSVNVAADYTRSYGFQIRPVKSV